MDLAAWEELNVAGRMSAGCGKIGNPAFLERDRPAGAHDIDIVERDRMCRHLKK
jgi:hypothetical protein